MPIRCKLPEIRARQGRLSLAQLSKATGITAANLSRLDRSQTTRIDFDTWEKLCKHFGLPPGEFFELLPEEPGNDFPARDLLADTAASPVVPS